MYLEKLVSALEVLTMVTVILIDSYNTRILYTGMIEGFINNVSDYKVVQVYLEKDNSYTILVRPLI